jgi:hypothetical protein
MLRVIEDHLGSTQVSRVIYGAIIGLALVVALEHDPPSSAVMVVTLLATALAVGLAEFYSEIVGTEVRLRRRVERQRIGEVAADVGAVAFGIAFPAIFFAFAVAGALEVDTAFAIAKWSGLGLIGIYGFAAARLAGAGLPAALAQASAVALIGAFLIVLKSLVH